MDTYIFTIFLIILTLIILVIYIYVWVFEIRPINDSSNNIILLGLESMAVENYLKQGKTIPATLLTFYEKPNQTDTYIDISYTYTTAPSGLSFTIYNSDDSSVIKSSKIIKNTNNFKEERIYFNNTGSNYYTIKYTLDENNNNSNNIQIARIELKV